MKKILLISFLTICIISCQSNSNFNESGKFYKGIDNDKELYLTFINDTIIAFNSDSLKTCGWNFMKFESNENGLFKTNELKTDTVWFRAKEKNVEMTATNENLIFEKFELPNSEIDKINIGDAVEEYNSGNGIQLWYSKNVEVEHNFIQHVRDGIYLEFSNFCTIKNNVSALNIRYGLHFMFSNDDTYQDNTFENNGAGVAVMFSKRIKMYNNIFKENWGTASYGMLLKEINDAEIIGNIFEENTIGINIEGSNRITYKHNNFKNNGWAIKVRGACYTNHFLENNFLYNSFDIAYNSKVNDNIFDRNFWSNYTGYDLDKNGIGDVPYRPVKLFSYIVNRTPETIILLRSMFIDIIDFSEKVSPVFTPDNLLDNNPLTKQITW